MKFQHILFVWLIFRYEYIQSQISPGPLANAHKHLEGISNCTKCHDIGKKVTNEKCLSCHTDVKTRIDQKQGYHVSAQVKSVSCVTCHNDHHGLHFELIHFDKATFNHTLTGYSLSGKHSTTSCNQCHQKSNIVNEKLKQKTNTYLGLDTKCVTCHIDVHKGTLEQNCADCHSTSSFSPAPKFDHKKTNYTLKGKHSSVSCEKCHKQNNQDKKSILFEGVRYEQCNSCHTNVHSPKFGPNCKACHNEQSFANLNTTLSFSHSNTGFSLNGRHKTVDCKQCHTASWSTIKSAFIDFKNKPTEQCITCHRDIHESKFGNDCIKCHTENSFKLKQVNSNFNHGLTDFPLEGKHQFVECKKCHTGKMTDPLAYKTCMECHTDYHQGEFNQNNKTKDCAACHSIDGFQKVMYTLEQHESSSFPLEGAHLAVSCDQCHLKNQAWKFRKIGQECADCHQDIHASVLQAKFYPDQKCTNCHVNQNWQTIIFDHSITDFQLTGKHKTQTCSSCHSDSHSIKQRNLKFRLLSRDCNSCHKDIHKGQFKINQITDCARCHDTERWKIPQFNHDLTAFRLDGKHKNVSCGKCHTPITIDSQWVVKYKLEHFACYDCHK